MKPSKKYEPISCVFYDLIEHYAVLKEAVEIKTKSADAIQTYTSRILDTKVVDKVEYMLIESPEQLIRMDDIISINGDKLADYTNC